MTAAQPVEIMVMNEAWHDIFDKEWITSSLDPLHSVCLGTDTP